MAAAVPAATAMEAAAGAMDRASAVEATRTMVEVVVMATEVVMLFPAVMDVEARRITAPSPSVRRVPIRGIVGIAIAAPTAAAVTAAVKASAESADTQAKEDKNWNCAS